MGDIISKTLISSFFFFFLGVEEKPCVWEIQKDVVFERGNHFLVYKEVISKAINLKVKENKSYLYPKFVEYFIQKLL